MYFTLNYIIIHYCSIIYYNISYYSILYNTVRDVPENMIQHKGWTSTEGHIKGCGAK